MYARPTTLGILSAMALALPVPQAPRFTLDTTGAISLRVAGREARYGMIPPVADAPPMLSVSLGATGANGALQLTMPGRDLPAPGRYPIRSTWGDTAGVTAFHASFAAGSPEHPLGWFHGEAGWVTITRATGGRLSGRFEILARGFLSADTADDHRLVLVTGSFRADGDTSTTTITAAR